MTDAPPGRSEPLARTSVLNRLLREPRRFGFDAMVRVLMHATLKD
ncbi:MAG: hypothetical protein QOG73_1775, partial [Acetobacteraceae bacterium]|nr:hypothetical protein [Acetobacteraceae bacterium]